MVGSLRDVINGERIPWLSGRTARPHVSSAVKESLGSVVSTFVLGVLIRFQRAEIN